MAIYKDYRWLILRYNEYVWDTKWKGLSFDNLFFKLKKVIIKMKSLEKYKDKEEFTFALSLFDYSCNVFSWVLYEDFTKADDNFLSASRIVLDLLTVWEDWGILKEEETEYYRLMNLTTSSLYFWLC